MKKIVNPTGNIRLVGMAEKDGVAFEASKFLGPMGISVPGTLAIVDSSNKVNCNPFDFDAEKPLIDKKILKFSEIAFKISTILSIIFMVSSIVCIFTATRFYDVLFNLGLLMLSATFLPNGLAIFFARILGDSDIKSFSKFLSAKNAVQNAFYDLGRIPNIEESKKYSTFSPDSKYLKNAPLAIFIIVLSFARFLPTVWYLVVFILTMIATIMLDNSKMFFSGNF